MAQWWQKAVIYQIYPKSFQDSNGDGIGDIPGIISRLDYLAGLGIDAIWLSPVYQSPGVDNGYDIADYEAIDPQYGTMADMDELIMQARKRGIRIIMDLVVNHTSDQHEWFKQARSSRDNPYRDYYVWRDGRDGNPPNDMQSTFSGSAWTYDKASGQYYLHLFAAQQPDLNWENPELRQAVYKMMNFWIAKGIGGFRMDVIDLIGKIPDAQIRENGPHLHDYLKEMRAATIGDQDLMTVGETWGATPAIAQQYSDPARHELSMVFQFEAMQLDQQAGKEKWDLMPLDHATLKAVLVKWQTELDYTAGWNSQFWNNHDLPRIVSRWGDDGQYRVKSAQMFAILLHLLRGTPYIYQGEEIGMTNHHVKSIDEVSDIESRNMYRERLAAGYSESAILHSINVKGRDNARTPMQWTDTRNAGFSTGQPWLAVNPNYKQINVTNTLREADSVYRTYRQLIKLRHEEPIITSGSFTNITNVPRTVMAYYRQANQQRWLVVANMTAETPTIDLPDTAKQLVIGNEPDSDLNLQKRVLRPYEAFVVEV
ncbi:glycoside hydrolase family 13 protein [Lacticaseibacillus songhuajiangensis]|jgi:glucan 1,6-alpha-glucosidase|uniref:glycoside hydrolase family 13 protein n=1 Tax=Lacticaseibacillus songhuajiangensis TaxID=1296539 RepID=UPI000F777CFF|nr:alpha-glucosidase [Lacticaseibacillus songhuajiangensis]